MLSYMELNKSEEEIHTGRVKNPYPSQSVAIDMSREIPTAVSCETC